MSVQRVPLRHYRLVSRVPFLEVVDDALSVRLPSVFGGRVRWTIPLSDVGVVRVGHLSQVSQPQGMGRVFVMPIVMPYFATTSANVAPNLQLVFRTPRRIPPIRWAAAFNNTSLSHRRSRSADGIGLDGVALRAVNPAAAVEVLVQAGAEEVPSAGWWLAEHRETTTEPAMVDAIHAAEKRRRGTAKAVAAAIPLLVLARWGLDHSTSWWPYAAGVLCLLAVFGAPAWAKRCNRQLYEQTRASAKDAARKS